VCQPTAPNDLFFDPFLEGLINRVFAQPNCSGSSPSYEALLVLWISCDINVKAWIIIEAEIGGQECLKLTLFLESHFWVSQPKSMSGHFQTTASLIYVSIA
jgi:hypothetical protein